MAYYSMNGAPIDSARFEFLEAPPDTLLIGFSFGVPIKDTTRLPKAMRQMDTKKLHDVMPVPGMYSVSGNFRQAVEEFEPGQHQFFPIECYQKDGSRHEGDWYILNICVRLPVLIPTIPLLPVPMRTASEKVWEFGIGAGEPFYGSLDHDTCLVSKPATEGRHLFGTRVYSRPEWICSEPLYQRLKELCRGGRASGEKWEVLGLEFEPIAETEEPWNAAKHAPFWHDWALNRPEEVKRMGYQAYV